MPRVLKFIGSARGLFLLALLAAISVWFWSKGRPLLATGPDDGDQPESVVARLTHKESNADRLGPASPTKNEVGYRTKAVELQTIKDCLEPNGRFNAVLSSPDFTLRDLLEVQSENRPITLQTKLHFEARGEKFRLVSSSVGNGGEDLKSDLRLFQVAKDGLPDPVEWWPDWKGLTAAEVMRRVSEREQVTREEQDIEWQLDPDSKMTYSTVDQQVVELQIWLKGASRSLGCQLKDGDRFHCKCMTTSPNA